MWRKMDVGNRHAVSKQHAILPGVRAATGERKMITAHRIIFRANHRVCVARAVVCLLVGVLFGMTVVQLWVYPQCVIIQRHDLPGYRFTDGGWNYAIIVTGKGEE